jgi:hypothetical protein
MLRSVHVPMGLAMEAMAVAIVRWLAIDSGGDQIIIHSQGSQA